MVNEDPNFVAVKRFEYNIDKLIARYPDGCPDHVIEDALLIEEGGVPARYEALVNKLRGLMDVEAD